MTARHFTAALPAALLLCGLWSGASCLPQPPRNQSASKPSRDKVPEENLVRPLENIADRFLKSNTVGVVDSIAAEAIGALSRFVDGAGLAFVDIIDSLPTAIDSMTDAVDGVVRTVDHIGRNVAVIVTAPGRINSPEAQSETANTLSSEREGVPKSEAKPNRRSSPTTRLLDRLTERRERRQEILRNFFNIDRDVEENSVNPGANPELTPLRRTNRRTNTGPELPHGTVPAPNGGIRSILSMFRLPQNGSNGTNADGVEAVTAVNSIARALGRTLFASQAARRNQAASNNLILNGTFSESQEREPTVFERNFEASKTQASINRLEKEVGSFLGRLLGTIYRNADPIDESLSKGIRRVLGARVPNSTNDAGTTKISAVSAPSDSTKSAESSTGSPVAGTTRRPFQFRLSFDDIDPAPARNSDHSGP